MSLWLIVSGILAGLGVFLLARRDHPAPGPARRGAGPARRRPGASPATRPAAGGWPGGSPPRCPGCPVPSADLALLGQDRESWLASKVVCGLLGLALPAVLVGLAALGGDRLPLDGPRRRLARLRRGPVLRP